MPTGPAPMMATSTSFNWVIVVLAGCGPVRTGVTCAAYGSVSPCGYSHGLDPLQGSVCDGAAAPEDEAGRWRTRSGCRGVTEYAKRIHFCFGSAPPTVTSFLSRKISSVVYGLISSLQDTFGSL